MKFLILYEFKVLQGSETMERIQRESCKAGAPETQKLHLLEYLLDHPTPGKWHFQLVLLPKNEVTCTKNLPREVPSAVTQSPHDVRGT